MAQCAAQLDAYWCAICFVSCATFYPDTQYILFVWPTKGGVNSVSGCKRETHATFWANIELPLVNNSQDWSKTEATFGGPFWCSLLCLTLRTRTMSLVACCIWRLHQRSGYVTTGTKKDASTLTTDEAIWIAELPPKIHRSKFKTAFSVILSMKQT